MTGTAADLLGPLSQASAASIGDSAARAMSQATSETLAPPGRNVMTTPKYSTRRRSHHGQSLPPRTDQSAFVPPASDPSSTLDDVPAVLQG
jgi:hypothetical protein